MKRYARVFKYINAYRGSVLLYVLFILLSIVFSIISIGMLMPFFELIFNGDKSTAGLIKTSENGVVKYIRDFLMQRITESGNEVTGKLKTLTLICVLIISSIFLKNVFLYLSFYVLNPLKNKVVNRLRSDLYEKMLHLPIGYFTEKKKGDLISRITNDVGEVEGSVVGALEGWIRDPFTILLNFAVLFYVSPQLTAFVLLFIPVVGFVIGRITRSLKKQSVEVAQKSAESVSLLDETLGGLRVIKAFTIEPLMRPPKYKMPQKITTPKNSDVGEARSRR